MKYLIIETIDTASSAAGVDITLFKSTNLFDAECALTKFLNLGHDAYLLEIDE